MATTPLTHNTNLRIQPIHHQGEFPAYNQYTSLYDFIEDDIDDGVFKATETMEETDPRTGRTRIVKVNKTVNIVPIEKEINKNFRYRSNNDTDFWANALGVREKTLAKKRDAQRDYRVMYDKNLTIGQMKNPEYLYGNFGIGKPQNPGGPPVSVFKSYYDYYEFKDYDRHDFESDKDYDERIDDGEYRAAMKQDSIVYSGFIGGYTRRSIGDWMRNAEYVRDNFPIAYQFTIERDPFTDVPFKVPLVHAVMLLSEDQKLVYLLGLWRSLYGQMRYFSLDVDQPRGLGTYVLKEALRYVYAMHPTIELMLTDAQEATIHILNKVGAQLYMNTTEMSFPEEGLLLDLGRTAMLREEFPVMNDELHFKHYLYPNRLQFLLSDRERPTIRCSICQEPATHICTECNQEFCNKCTDF